MHDDTTLLDHGGQYAFLKQENYIYLSSVVSRQKGFGTAVMRKIITLALEAHLDVQLQAAFSSHVFHLYMGMIPVRTEIGINRIYGYFAISALDQLQKNGAYELVDHEVFDLGRMLKSECKWPEEKMPTKDDIHQNRELLLKLKEKKYSYIEHSFFPNLLNVLQTCPEKKLNDPFDEESIDMRLSEAGRLRWKQAIDHDIDFVPFRDFSHLTPYLTDEQRHQLRITLEQRTAALPILEFNINFSNQPFSNIMPHAQTLSDNLITMKNNMPSDAPLINQWVNDKCRQIITKAEEAVRKALQMDAENVRSALDIINHEKIIRNDHVYAEINTRRTMETQCKLGGIEAVARNELEATQETIRLGLATQMAISEKVMLQEVASRKDLEGAQRTIRLALATQRPISEEEIHRKIIEHEQHKATSFFTTQEQIERNGLGRMIDSNKSYTSNRYIVACTKTKSAKDQRIKTLLNELNLLLKAEHSSAIQLKEKVRQLTFVVCENRSSVSAFYRGKHSTKTVSAQNIIKVLSQSDVTFNALIDKPSKWTTPKAREQAIEALMNDYIVSEKKEAGPLVTKNSI